MTDADQPELPLTQQKYVSVFLSNEEHRQLFDAARRSRTSISALSHLALKQFLLFDRQSPLRPLPPAKEAK